VEGVFSSSMYASSIQMCKREPPKAGHLLFISPSKKLAVGHFHCAEIGGTGRYQVITGRSTPSVRCSGVGHVSFFGSHVLVSNDYLQHTGRSASPHRTRPVHTGLMRREFRKPQGYRTLSTGSVRCSPDPCIERVTKRPHTERTPPDA